MSNELLIRPATTEDRTKIKEIIDSSFPRFFRFFANSSVGSGDGKVLVSENQGIIAGFAKLIEFNIGASKYGCILWIAVRPSFRLRGIALSLTLASLACLKEDGAQAVFASTQRRNRAAQATLSKAGFERVSFLDLFRVFGWRVFEVYGDIWFAPNEIVLRHK